MSSNIDALKAAMTEGNTAFAAGDFEGALSAFTKCLDLTSVPTQLCTIHTNRGAALQRLGRLDEAVTAFSNALEGKPTYLQAHFNKGVTLKALGKFEEAQESFEKALEQKEDFYPAWCGKSEVLAAVGKYAEAIEAANKAVSLEPESPTAYVDRAFAFLKSKSFAEAIKDYNASNDKSDETQQLLAHALEQQAGVLDTAGKTKQAMTFLKKALKIKETASRNFSIGVLNYRDKKLKTAKKSLERALQMDPEHANAAAVLGGILVADGDHKTALPLLQQAYRAETVMVVDKHSLMQNLGVAYMHNGDEASAREIFEAIVKEDPNHAQANMAITALNDANGETIIRQELPKASPHVASSGKLEPAAPESSTTASAPQVSQDTQGHLQKEKPSKLPPSTGASNESPSKASSEGSESLQVYSLAELQAPGPYPGGIDVKKRHLYLSDEDFAALFNMDKEKFEALPNWKKANAKKKHKLF